MTDSNATLTCPHFGHRAHEVMPTDRCIVGEKNRCILPNVTATQLPRIRARFSELAGTMSG